MKKRFYCKKVGYHYIYSEIRRDHPDLTVSEKDILRDLLWKASDFSEVQVITYCIMPRAFYALVKVPEPRNISTAELLDKAKILYGEGTLSYKLCAQKFERARKGGSKQTEQALKDMLLRRMHHLGEFVRYFKHRFSIHYNKTNGTTGCVWYSGPYHSVVLDAPTDDNVTRQAIPLIKKTALFIDLYPYAETLVSEPADYRWSGYGEAERGFAPAIEGQRFLHELKA